MLETSVFKAIGREAITKVAATAAQKILRRLQATHLNETAQKTKQRIGQLLRYATVVQRVLELHDGSIFAPSAGFGRGSEFTARIPLAPATGQLLRGERRDAEIPSGPLPRRVLIVDDNVDDGDTAAALVNALGP